MRIGLLAPLVLCAAVPLLAPTDAHACGGCYHRQSETETTVVTGHRMVLSVSPVQSVLWDQIEYSGDPTDFAWVLPVKAGARVELATDAWFEALDAATAVRVVGPELDCPSAPGADRGGCGSVQEDSGGGLDFAEGDPHAGGGVTVVHEGTVGPYETVTLSTSTPGALNDWLSKHDYAVDADVQPIIDAYVAEHFDFIALRLQPGKGVRAMKPVRVVSPGATPTLPLRMVAAGTGAHVGITLFVIGEGRWATKNFPNGGVPVDELSWDHLAVESNYAKLREEAIGGNGGKTWLTVFAKLGALLSPVPNPISGGNVRYASDDFGSTETIADAYLAQATKNGENAADDLAVALTGLHPQDVWLTRLESDLPRAALATDLELEPASSQDAVENWLAPKIVLNAQQVCRGAGDLAVVPRAGGTGEPSRRLPFAALVAASCLVLAAARRTRRRSAAIST